MIHTSRRPLGARSLVVITTVALSGVVPQLGAGREARADGPVRPRAGRYYPPTHRIAGPRRPVRPVHRTRRHVRPQVAKVSIDTRSPGAAVLPGKVYNWPFVVRNRGTVRADAVTFSAPLSGTLQFVSAQQHCSFKDAAAVCQLGSLKPGESKAGVVTAMVADKAPGGLPIDNDALVKWHTAPANKEGLATAAFPEVKVADTADVSVVKGAPAMVRPGQRVPYQITVANNGPTAARNVTLISTSIPALNQAAPGCSGQRPRNGAQQGAPDGGHAGGQDDPVGDGQLGGPGRPRGGTQAGGVQAGGGHAGGVQAGGGQAGGVQAGGTQAGGTQAGGGHAGGQGGPVGDGQLGGPGRPRGGTQAGGTQAGGTQAGGVQAGGGHAGGTQAGGGHAGGQGDGVDGNGQGRGPDRGQGDASPGGAPGLVCDIGTLQPGETRAIKINAEARTALKPGTVIQAPSQVTTTTIDNNLANNHADVRTTVAAPPAPPAPHTPPALQAPPVRQVASRAGPGGVTGLPSTGAPIREMMHLVVVLLGMGLIFYRFGRSRRRER
jgi:uncharacterized repeat protein (TIGR01451 family)